VCFLRITMSYKYHMRGLIPAADHFECPGYTMISIVKGRELTLPPAVHGALFRRFHSTSNTFPRENIHSYALDGRQLPKANARITYPTRVTSPNVQSRSCAFILVGNIDKTPQERGLSASVLLSWVQVQIKPPLMSSCSATCVVSTFPT
jgi:hypothetical protein